MNCMLVPCVKKYQICFPTRPKRLMWFLGLRFEAVDKVCKVNVYSVKCINWTDSRYVWQINMIVYCIIRYSICDALKYL